MRDGMRELVADVLGRIIGGALGRGGVRRVACAHRGAGRGGPDPPPRATPAVPAGEHGRESAEPAAPGPPAGGPERGRAPRQAGRPPHRRRGHGGRRPGTCRTCCPTSTGSWWSTPPTRPRTPTSPGWRRSTSTTTPSRHPSRRRRRPGSGAVRLDRFNRPPAAQLRRLMSARHPFETRAIEAGPVRARPGPDALRPRPPRVPHDVGPFWARCARGAARLRRPARDAGGPTHLTLALAGLSNALSCLCAAHHRDHVARRRTQDP